MTRIETLLLISAVFLAAAPASAKWLEPTVLTDTGTWRHTYHFPKYSEYYAVVLEDKDPDQLLRDIEHRVVQQGGVIPRLVNRVPLPKGVSQTRYNLPQKGASSFVKSLLENHNVKIFNSETFANSYSEPAANPKELYSKQEVLARACSKVRSQGKSGPALAAFCTYEKNRIDDIIAAYEQTQGLARLLVAVVPPGVQYTPDTAPFTDAWVEIRPALPKDDPKEIGYWIESEDGHCAANIQAVQITLSAKASLAAAQNSRALFEKRGWRPLSDDCALPTRLQPGQTKERIVEARNYAVPDSELASVPAALRTAGTITYNGPLNTYVWAASTELSSKKSKILAAALAENPPIFKEVPAFKTLVELTSQRLQGSANAYEATKGSTPVHLVVMAAP